eukprot:gnl/TRDRNA2_/TRDRNA2_178239_c0_seq1.p1 gnl/TRDRNA2_/TRDRNA2_178239_c0~~gnl/TRDRNA2_/TRDRNA2_178239_c0_seq1.p1  ORF type:complete len:240 (+),score=50.69 gnl/TRDRNA2_/TRDRNA2_178239_c0_seq1:100-720(+)
MQAKKSMAKPAPVDPSADVKEAVPSNTSSSEAIAIKKASKGAHAKPKGVVQKVGCSILASSKAPSKQTTTEKWSWLPQMFRQRSCSAPKRALASSSRKRSNSVPKKSDEQPKPVLEAKPAGTPWRAIDDFEAAAAGDTQAICDFMADEKVENVLDAVPVLEAVPEILPVPTANAPTAATAPPTSSSWFLWQCMAPNVDNGSELHLA